MGLIEHYPLEQGLRQLIRSSDITHETCLIEHYPLEQGLRQFQFRLLTV